jgi:hypothetical protein
MPAPIVIFESAATAASTGAISITRPAAGISKAGDLELLFISSANQVVATPTGFTIHPQSPVGVGTAASTTATRLSIFYRWSLGETTAISVADSGDHTNGMLCVLRGVDPITPFQAITTFSSATTGTSFSQTGLNVTTDFASLLFAAVADQIDSTSAQGITPNCTFNPSLTPTWVAKSYRTTQGVGGGITYRRAQIDDPSANAVTALSITSTGSIIPCAIYFYVRGTRFTSAEVGVRSFVGYNTSSTGSDGPVSRQIQGASGAAVNGTGTINITRASGLITGAIEFIFAEYPGGALTVPVGWNHVDGSPVVNNDASYPTALAVLWRIANGDTGTIPLTAPSDHIIAFHRFFTNVDEVQPFWRNVRADLQFSGNIGGYGSVEAYEETPIIAYIEPPLLSNFAAICAVANSVDTTTTGQLSISNAVGAGNGGYFYNSYEVHPNAVQTSTGHGGGIGVAVYAGETVDDPAQYRKFRFNSVGIYREGSSTCGYAGISFGLKCKTSRNFRASAAKISSVTSILTNHTSVGGAPDTCPKVFSRSPLIYSNTASSVPSPYLKSDGNVISDPAEYNGKLEFLLIQTYPNEACSITSGGGWQLVSNGFIQSGGGPDFRVYYRIHPNNAAANVTLSDAGDYHGAMRIMVEGAVAQEPILTTTQGVDRIPDGWYQSHLGGNGYAAEWPYYGDMVIPAAMNLILGFTAKRYNDSTNFWGQIGLNPGPNTSLDTWSLSIGGAPGNVGCFDLWEGKRFWPTTESGKLDPARLGRMAPPRMGDYADYWEMRANIWIAIPSVYIPPTKYGQADVQHYAKIKTVAIAQNECPNLFAYGVKGEGTTTASIPPATIKLDGGIITDASERDGRFELLICEISTGTVDTPADWNVVPVVRVNTQTQIFAFWRWHPDGDNSAVSITGPTNHVVGSRIIFDNVNATDPILTTCYNYYSYTCAPERGGNSGGYGDVRSNEGKNGVFAIAACPLDAEVRLFTQVDGEDSVYVDYMNPSFGNPYVDGWGVMPSASGIGHLVGTTQGDGGNLVYFWGKRVKNTVDPGNYYSNWPYIMRLTSLGDFQYTDSQAGLWIVLKSDSTPKIAQQPASILHTSSFSTTATRSLKEERYYVRIELVSTATSTASRSKEGLRPATIILLEAVTALGIVTPGSPALVYHEGLIICATKKDSKVLPALLMIAQAVPVIRKNILLSASSLHTSSVFASVVVEEVIVPSGPGREFFANAASYTLAEGFFSVDGAATIEISLSLLTESSKRTFLGFNAPVECSLSCSCRKGSRGLVALSVVQTLSCDCFKNARVANPIDILEILNCLGQKVSSRQALFDLSASAWANGLLIATFEYGDIVVVDLRAALDFGILDATRNNLALEVRRGVGTDYERVADNPVNEARRSLPEEFLGSATKLDGIEIVCVREIFDENK